MMPLKDWLKRGEKRPKQKKRIRPMSKKRAAEQAIYLKRRKVFLRGHPLCQAWSTIVLWAVKTNDKAAFGAPSFCPLSVEIHHTRKPKQTYYLDESTWLAVCRWSHRWIEDHKDIARQLGLLAQ